LQIFLIELLAPDGPIIVIFKKSRVVIGIIRLIIYAVNDAEKPVFAVLEYPVQVLAEIRGHDLLAVLLAYRTDRVRRENRPFREIYVFKIFIIQVRQPRPAVILFFE